MSVGPPMEKAIDGQECARYDSSRTGDENAFPSKIRKPIDDC